MIIALTAAWLLVFLDRRDHTVISGIASEAACHKLMDEAFGYDIPFGGGHRVPPHQCITYEALK